MLLPFRTQPGFARARWQGWRKHDRPRVDQDEWLGAMDQELLVEEIGHYEALLQVQRRNLRVLELQAARHGPFNVPVHIQGAQNELRAEIARIERTLLALRAQLDIMRGAIVADHPAVDGQISFLATADLLATGRFYGELIGLALVLDRADCRIYRVAAGAYLGFCQAPSGCVLPPQEWPIVTIVSSDVDGWYAHLSGRGVTTDGIPRMDKRRAIYHFFARDPNGYLIEVRRHDEL